MNKVKRLEKLNYIASKSVTESAEYIVVETIGKDRTDRLFSHFVNGQGVKEDDEGYPVQVYYMTTIESIEEFKDLNGIWFRFPYESILYDASIKLEFEQPAQFL